MKKKFLGWILFLITICNGQYVGAQELQMYMADNILS